MKKKQGKVVTSSLDYLNFDSFFDSEVNEFRKNLRNQLQEKVFDEMPDLVERAEYPDKFVPLLQELGLGTIYLSKPYGEGKNIRKLIAAILELSRCDASLATMYLVQAILLMNTIDDFASEEQKAILLPKLASFELIGGWGLTETNIGSDASNMETRCRQLDNGDWVINGNKRWIGNANKDIMVVFAKDEKTGNVQGFIVDLKSSPDNIKRSMIKRKMALRSVHNMVIEFNGLVVSQKWKMPKVVNFQSVAKMLAHSRLFVSWVACGIGLGVYDYAIKYLDQRQQFNKKLTNYQLIQEKLVRIMGNVQACLHLSAKLTELKEQKKDSIGKLALGKAWVTLKIREAAALGREMLGGNGIVLDNYLMKAFVDMEAIYTYEGTYDINSLVAGRELTGFAAFK